MQLSEDLMIKIAVAVAMIIITVTTSIKRKHRKVKVHKGIFWLFENTVGRLIIAIWLVILIWLVCMTGFDIGREIYFVLK